MKKVRIYTTFVVMTALMLWASSCKSIDEGIKYSSTTGCCSYTVFEDKCLQYEEDGYHTTVCWDNQTTFEQTVHEIEENCYKNH